MMFPLRLIQSLALVVSMFQSALTNQGVDAAFLAPGTSQKQYSSLRSSSSYLDNLMPPQDEAASKLTEDPLNELLRIAAATDRGQLATKEQMDSAMYWVDMLEDSPRSGTGSTRSTDTVGTWELVFSSTQLFRSSPFFMAGRAVCSTEEEAKQYDWFCDMHRAALAISTIGVVRQVVSETRLVSEFEVKVGSIPFLSDFTPFRYAGGLPVTIDGAIVSSADITPMETSSGSDELSWEIFMDKVEIKGSNIPLLRQLLDRGLALESRGLGSFLETNLDEYTNPKPIFSTTYLTDRIRVSRDQDGKVFVYSKVSDDSEPTNYDNVLPDLGIASLLEGFNDAITKFYI